MTRFHSDTKPNNNREDPRDSTALMMCRQRPGQQSTTVSFCDWDDASASIGVAFPMINWSPREFIRRPPLSPLIDNSYLGGERESRRNIHRAVS